MNFLREILEAVIEGGITWGIAGVIFLFLPLHLIPSWDACLILGVGAFARKLLSS